MRTSRILVVVAVVAALACISAMAAGDTPNRPPGQGRAYLKSDIWKGVSDRVVPLPIAGEPGGGMERAGKIDGPLSVAGARSSTSLDAAPGGSAIPSMGSGTFMTPMDRTKVQIQRLIRKLG